MKNNTTRTKKTKKHMDINKKCASLIEEYESKSTVWFEAYRKYAELLEKLEQATAERDKPTGLSLEETMKLFTDTYLMALVTLRLYLDQYGLTGSKPLPQEITRWAASVCLLEFDRTWVEIFDVHARVLCNKYTEVIGKNLYPMLYDKFYRALEDITVTLSDYVDNPQSFYAALSENRELDDKYYRDMQKNNEEE